MEEIFGNIFYLIPIALIIVFRIINAKNKQNKQQQQKPGGKPASGGLLEELIRKVNEAEQKSSYERKYESREVYPAAQRTSAGRPGELKKKKPVKKPTAENQYFIPQESSSLSAALAKTADINAAKTVIPEQRSPHLQTGVSIQDLTPLQQAVVWSEILGKPKGMRIDDARINAILGAIP